MRQPKLSEKPPSPRRSKSEMLAVAAEVFSELGYDGASIDVIAQRLGSSKGRIYHYYKSKAELFLEVQKTAMIRMIETIGPIVQLDIPPDEKLACMAFAHARLIMSDVASQSVAMQGLTRHLVDHLSKNHPEQVAFMMKSRDDFEGFYSRVIDDGVASGRFVEVPGRFAAKPILGSLNWITLWYRARKRQTDADLDELARIHSEYALRSIRRPSALSWVA